MSRRSKKFLTPNEVGDICWLIDGGSSEKWPKEIKERLRAGVIALAESPSNAKPAKEGDDGQAR